MQAAMVPFNQAMMSGELPELEMGIGVNVGEVVVGNIGSEARTKYGIVGTAVNITQRIQAEAKGGQILLSESAYAPIKDKVTVSESFHRRLKGINEDVRLHVLQRVLDCRDVSGKGPEKEIVW
jgi:class 3 adenylate cyclase